MAMDIDMKKAADILADVPPEKSFQLKDGRTLKNLYDLQEVSSDMSDDTFSHHATEGRNDFSNWVRYVHKDEELAKKLEEGKTQKEIQKFVKDRIEILHKLRGIEERPKRDVKTEGVKTVSPERVKIIKPKMVRTVKPKKVKIVPVKPVSIREAKIKKRFKLPARLTLGESKIAEKQLCPHHYFMKCSSTHFLLGIVAGFLIGILIASI